MPGGNWNHPPPAIKSPHPIHLFYSYSHKDNALRDKLEEALTMLKRKD